MELVGHFKCIKNENLNNFLKAIGVSFIARLFMRWGKPSVAVLKFEDYWSITVKSFFVSREKYFKLGQEFTEFLPGKVIKSTATMVNENLVIRSVTDYKIKTKTTYEFDAKGLVIRIADEKTGIEAKRYFKKLPIKL